MRVLTAFAVATVLLAGCGDDDAAAPATTAATPDTEGTDETGDTGNTATTTSAGVELVATGEPTPFEPADGRPVELTAGADGSCTSEQTTFDDDPETFALCQVFEGFAIVTISREVDDHDTGIACADGDGFTLLATSIGTGTPVTTTVSLDGGTSDVAVLTVHDGFIGDATSAEGVVVAVPPGRDCPSVHGLGPVAPGTGTVLSHTDVVQVEAADGSLLCTTFDDGALVTTTAPDGAPRCPEPGG